MNQKGQGDAFSSPLLKLIGCQVVREPDWRWGKQDGGEGHVGTVVKFESADECVVIWDNGNEANYSCSIFYDIYTLDASMCDIVHEGVRCAYCYKTSIRGIRWQCIDCLKYDALNINLCSKCYHSDQHNLKHRFSRMLTPISER
jgi:E3 ubiquitin-protein ligase mind-bomb